MADDLDFLCDGPSAADTTLILAHGAGAPMDSRFMAFFAAELGRRKLRVVRFEFPYMARRRHGAKSPPDREPILRQTWLKVIEKVRRDTDAITIGGKSMGGRIASLIADDAQVAGLVCLGYPFHPVGKPEALRVEHLRALQTPTLILQGERDPFGSREDVARYELPAALQVQWIPDGDHSFKPRKSSGRTEQENWQAAADAIAAFVQAE